jgi:hypothetical protein
VAYSQFQEHENLLMQVSLATLSAWTGLHRDTISKRLSSLLTGKRGETVDSVEALPLIFGSGGKLDPAQEKARLDKFKRQAAGIDLQLKRREVILLSECFAAIDAGVLVCRERLLCIPGRFAAILADETDPMTIERTMDAEIRQALNDIADTGEQFRRAK